MVHFLTNENKMKFEPYSHRISRNLVYKVTFAENYFPENLRSQLALS